MSMKEIEGACKEPDPCTKEFINQHTMLRIKDPRKSLDFYTRVLGMRLIQMFDQPEAKRALFFVGYASPGNIPKDQRDKIRWMFLQPGDIELWYDYGAHKSDTKMHSGNSKPLGYGHIGIAVPDVTAACQRFEELGVEFEMKVGEGIIKDLAYIKDPDGYWIEILNGATLALL
ncbi:lactoylglutathione lyase-like [Glandiceps talaboti]